jgi:hypothetical protein
LLSFFFFSFTYLQFFTDITQRNGKANDNQSRTTTMTNNDHQSMVFVGDKRGSEEMAVWVYKVRPHPSNLSFWLYLLQIAGMTGHYFIFTQQRSVIATTFVWHHPSLARNARMKELNAPSPSTRAT